MNEQTIQQLPIVGVRGRKPLNFINFQPGVVVGGNTGGGVNINGTRDCAQNCTLDGIDINEDSAEGSDFSSLRVLRSNLSRRSDLEKQGVLLSESAWTTFLLTAPPQLLYS